MARYGRALVAAYAASVTLLAAWWGMQARSYRRFFDGLPRRSGGRPAVPPGLRSLFLDHGVGLTPWDELAVRFADLGIRTVLIMIVLVFAASLGIASMARANPADVTVPVAGDGIDPLRWARRGTLASLMVGAATFGLTWISIRWRVLHPHPLPTVLLFAAQLAATVIALGSGAWLVLRGPRRAVAASLMLIALIPLVVWGFIGLYGWAHWQQRLVPNSLPMNLAKMAASSPMRLEASVEYPNRLETDRLVMLYDRLEHPRRDAEAMDRHLARMEGMLGGPLRAKVFWVRGDLPRLGLANLSVNGIALGSGESPADWDTGGGLDRHELAHAALDQYRAYDADPPFFLHEGWAESQSGVGTIALARRALEQRSATPSLGIREMAGPEWYHRDAGPVYPLGGAFVDHLIRTHGVGAFLRLYNGIRPGAFEASCREILGAELADVEAGFWEDMRRQVDESDRVPGDPP